MRGKGGARRMGKKKGGEKGEREKIKCGKGEKRERR